MNRRLFELVVDYCPIHNALIILRDTIDVVLGEWGRIAQMTNDYVDEVCRELGL